VVGVDVGVVTGASGAVGGSGVGSGVAKWTFFGGGVAVSTTLRSGLSVGGGAGVGVGVSITLRGGLPVGGGGGDVGTTLSVVVAVQMPVSNSVRFCKAMTCLSVRGAKDAAGDGCRRAVVMSCNAARIRSLDEGMGHGHLCWEP
jgi:hypothetical protein